MAVSITSVSGTLLNGSILTISGSGFGTKATASPVLWETYESGTVGQLVQNQNATIGKWDNDGYPVYYSTAHPHSGSKCGDHPMGAQTGQLVVSHDFSTAYIDFWGYLGNVIDNYSRNWKVWRVGNSGSPVIETIFAYYCPQNGNSHLTIYDEAGGGNIGGSWDPNPTGPVNNTVYHFEVAFKQSSIGVANGAIHQFINGQIQGYDSDSVMTRNSSTTYTNVTIGELWSVDALAECPANSGAHFYTDNIYIDNSWARVVIGDHSTWATSTHREIQIPSAWSSSSITITANQGSLASLTNQYLYVVDSVGNVNANGFQLTGFAPVTQTLTGRYRIA